MFSTASFLKENEKRRMKSNYERRNRSLMPTLLQRLSQRASSALTLSSRQGNILSMCPQRHFTEVSKSQGGQAPSWHFAWQVWGLPISKGEKNYCGCKEESGRPSYPVDRKLIFSRKSNRKSVWDPDSFLFYFRTKRSVGPFHKGSSRPLPVKTRIEGNRLKRKKIY